MSAPRMILLRLALRAAERGDSDACAEALRGVIAMQDAPAPAGELRAVSRARFAEMIGVTPEHVAHLIARGEIPTEALLGHGRGQRIILAAAVAALQPPSPKAATEGDDAIDEGAAYVRRKAALRVVRGQR